MLNNMLYDRLYNTKNSYIPKMDGVYIHVIRKKIIYVLYKKHVI